MQPGIFKGGTAVDDRGFVSFVNDFKFFQIKRFYMVENHKQDFVRAWHGHKKEEKYVYVVQGSILIGVTPLDSNTYKDQNPTDEMKTFVLSSRVPQILYIPKGHYNGFKTLEENTKIMFFSTSTLEESKDDDIRKGAFAWNIWKDNYR